LGENGSHPVDVRNCRPTGSNHEHDRLEEICQVGAGNPRVEGRKVGDQDVAVFLQFGHEVRQRIESCHQGTRRGGPTGSEDLHPFIYCFEAVLEGRCAIE
jgi:hypothetical protein